MSQTGEQDSQTKRIALGIVVALALAGGTWWYLHQRSAAVADAPLAVESDAAPVADGGAAAAPPAILHPLDLADPAQEEQSAAPVDPDAAVRAGLEEIFRSGDLAAWLLPEQLARRIAATTDNLSRNASVEKLRPLRAPQGRPVVQRETVDQVTGAERITLAPDNAARYDAAIRLLASADMAAAAGVYRRIYPHLQRAWEDLGYPGRYFNDRVVEVIDHLLATPEPTGPILLEQPKALYRFADPDLENRSAGQKLLLRIGVDHARAVKQKLREFRAQIVSKE